MRGVFVGRHCELAAAGALLAGGPLPAAVVVTGEPGVGKTRLVEELAAELDRPLLRAVGYEMEQAVPLAGAAGMLRRLAEAPVHGPLLGELVFGEDEAAAPPVRLLEAAHRAAAELGEATLLVDDVQWLDDLSLALVHYLLAGADQAGAPLRLVAAGRPSPRALSLTDGVDRLLGAERSLRLPLEPLPAGEAVELARALEPRLTPAAAAEVAERSGGVPFWVETLARSRDIRAASHVLTVRLRGAAGDGARLLALLAVVARPLDGREAAQLLEWPRARLDAAAAELEARGLGIASHGELRVTHDLLRAAAYAELPRSLRRDLHARVSQRLEAQAGEEVALLREALEHRLAAGEPPLELALRVLESPQRRRLGVQGLGTLAALADAAGHGSAASRALHRGVAALASELGEQRTALERWSELARLLEGGERFEALVRAAEAAFELGWETAPLAQAFAAEALVLAPTDEAVVRVLALRARLLLWLDHDTVAGGAAAREAVARSERLEPGPERSAARLAALRAAHQVAMQEGDGEAMLQTAAVMVSESGGDDAGYVGALHAVAVAESWTQPLHVPTETARRVLRLASERVLPTEAFAASEYLAGLLFDRGRLDEAQATLAAGQVLGVRVGERQPVRLLEHELRLAVEGHAAVPAYEEAVAALPDPHVRVIPRHVLARFVSAAGGPASSAKVAALLEAARADADAARCPRCSFELRLTSALAHARVGDADAAARELAVSGTETLERSFARHRRHAEAVYAARRGDAEAPPMLERVCAAYEADDRFVDLLWARVDLGRALLATAPREAERVLRLGLDDARERGFAAYCGVVEQELRRLGSRTWRRGATRGAELSRREREVAELVVGGATNPEIAQTLFLSRKTVERHVSSALAKVGARNRAELAALLAEERVRELTDDPAPGAS